MQVDRIGGGCDNQNCPARMMIWENWPGNKAGGLDNFIKFQNGFRYYISLFEMI